MARRTLVYIFLSAMLGMLIDHYLMPSAAQEPTQEPKRERPVEHQTDQAQPDHEQVKPPKDDAIYVWPPPVTGYESVVVLGVPGADVVDAAYLVPMRVRLRVSVSPDKADKAKDALEKVLGGQLRTALLFGVDPKSGLVLADFWINSDKDGKWASDILIGQGLATALDEPTKKETK